MKSKLLLLSLAVMSLSCSNNETTTLDEAALLPDTLLTVEDETIDKKEAVIRILMSSGILSDKQ